MVIWNLWEIYNSFVLKLKKKKYISEKFEFFWLNWIINRPNSISPSWISFVLKFWGSKSINGNFLCVHDEHFRANIKRKNCPWWVTWCGSPCKRTINIWMQIKKMVSPWCVWLDWCMNSVKWIRIQCISWERFQSTDMNNVESNGCVCGWKTCTHWV